MANRDTGPVDQAALQALSRGYLKPRAIRDIVAQHVGGRRDYGALWWTMMMMELWHREFID